MISGPVVDTDILLKVSAYKLAAELIALLGVYGTPGVLGLTHIIAPGQLQRMPNLLDLSGARAALANLLDALGSYEPDPAEVLMAAEFEATAQELGLPLDTGEAQLVAIAVQRQLPLLLTGDKRAIGAMAHLLSVDYRAQLTGRLACFEQAISAIAQRVGEQTVRERICGEPGVDTAMRLACSCDSPHWNPGQLHEACYSFIGDVRASAADLLVASLALA